MISRRAFLVVNGICPILVIIGVMLPKLITSGPTGIIGWALVAITLIVWLTFAVMRTRPFDR